MAVWDKANTHFRLMYTKYDVFFSYPMAILEIKRAQGGLSVADGCRCLTKELDMIAC